MSVAYNVFGPEDLALAESVLNEVWTSLPSGVRSGPHGPECRDWLARQVLASIRDDDINRDLLKKQLLNSDMTAWA
ncbi:hypothetical protein [Hyphomicrobium sp.]|uniref:hypothetical protein n=1 Tax=Hyphomicrobium sp. TaxID=82 RepID=UPI001DC9984C|nr:hypothetical protein [Hyphomicrobium sp.]MBY0559484.1 hypothetical protein [Hyphomicrobium sp.]